VIAALAAAPFASAFPGFAREPVADVDVLVDGGPYVPTPLGIVERMLDLAEVHAGDTVSDLGSGDGRLVVEAAAKRGARGVGVEREARLVELARENARKAGVEARVTFTQDDLFKLSLTEATVVTLYLLPRLLVLLAPKLRAELKPGARVVSHDYPLEGWPAERIVTFEDDDKMVTMGVGMTTLFLYRLPVPG
jgi:SAM-dependent methyltransferase